MECYLSTRMGTMSNELGQKQVEHVARLARLRLSPEETARFAGQLQRILAFAEQVQQVDTGQVAPMSHPFDHGSAAGRDDEVRPSLPREEALERAPDRDSDAALFRVPRVLG